MLGFDRTSGLSTNPRFRNDYFLHTIKYETHIDVIVFTPLRKFEYRHSHERTIVIFYFFQLIDVSHAESPSIWYLHVGIKPLNCCL